MKRRPWSGFEEGWSSLTAQEWLVVQLIANGHCQESIENQIEIKRNTVKRHVNNICRKLGINSSLQIACKFYQDLLLLQAATEDQEASNIALRVFHREGTSAPTSTHLA